MEKAVIWGHRPSFWNKRASFLLPPHTHSYIHAGYLRAFRELGLDVFWINHPDELGSLTLRGAMVFSEGQVDSQIPISDNVKYVTHHSSRPEFLDLKPNFLRLHNYVADLESGVSLDYEGFSVSKLNEVTYWDQANRALYQPWATDLLPSVKSIFSAESRRTRSVNYIGTLNHDGLESRFRVLRRAASEIGLRFKHFQGVSDVRARRLMAESYVTFDLRGDSHQKVGYIPCRLWKGMSYGRLMSTNSLRLRGVFGERLNYESSIEGILESAIEFERRNDDSNLVRENQEWVLRNHTFVNRALQILALI